MGFSRLGNKRELEQTEEEIQLFACLAVKDVFNMLGETCSLNFFTLFGNCLY